MSRASRMLKWPVAATVLLTAAPIAYAEPSTASTRPSAPADSERCGGRFGDFAGSFTVAGLADTGYRFDAGTMALIRSAGSASGTAAAGAGAGGVWQAGGGEIRWSVDGTTYAAGSAHVMCADAAAPAQVTSFTATAADGSGAVTLVRG